MKKCFRLAKKGLGKVTPNPLVGCVIVKNNQIISKAYHQEFGGPHAEFAAIQKCPDTKGATLYVNLEPCGTFGKNPPCAHEIIKAQISEVVFSIPDPNPINKGVGEKILLNNKIKVRKGLLAQEAEKLNRFFINFHQKKRPYICVKSAISLDGKIADNKGDSKWISNEKSRLEVQKLRKEFDAILVGRKTCELDNPRLSLRIQKAKDPLKIILDPEMKISPDAKLFSGSQVIWVTKFAKKKLSTFSKKADIEVLSLGNDFKLKKLLKKLHERKILSILVEGGGETNARFFEENLVDELVIFLAPKLIGGKNSPSMFDGTGFNLKKSLNLNDLELKKIGSDIMVRGFL